MRKRTFVVSHPRARAPLTVKGETLVDALLSEGLNPAIWKETNPTPGSEVTPDGDNQGDAGPKDN